jgi:hypothetical protein
MPIPKGQPSAGGGERSAEGSSAPFGTEVPVRARVSVDCASRVIPAASDNSRGCSIDNLADASDVSIETDA